QRIFSTPSLSLRTVLSSFVFPQFQLLQLLSLLIPARNSSPFLSLRSPSLFWGLKMKASLGKLKRFAFHQKQDGKERRDFHFPAKLDELVLASQEMQDMRNCYDGLLSAAAATANSAYEFSESLRDLGSCLLEKTVLCNDEESGKALLMLGKVQMELQKLLDRYRSNICLTITNPSESLLNELKTVEEMKRQCDEKRSVYEYMMAQEKEKGKLKSGKGDPFTMEQLQAAHSDYEEEATLCVFRLKSLKEGQSRSLLTQAARHHTAQLNFFKKGLKSLESVDQQVKQIAEKHHIDYQLCGLDEPEDDEGDGETNYDSNGDGELSFKYRLQKPGLEVVSTSRTSMELDQEDLSFPRPSTAEKAETLNQKPARVDNLQLNPQALESEHRASSHSAPIFPEKKFDPAERIKQMRPSRSQKFHSYVLPTPVDTKSSTSIRTGSSTARINPNSWHPSLMESSKFHRESKDENFSMPILKAEPASLARYSHDGSTHLPLPSVDLHLFAHDTLDASDPKKIKRQASFSGPLNSKPNLGKGGIAASDLIGLPDPPRLTSSSVSQASTSQPLSSRLSSNISSTASPPKISELHELPRPPSNAFIKSTRPSNPVGHSAPLTNKSQASGSSSVVPLLLPPLTTPRSLSIPSGSHRAMSLQATGILESNQLMDKAGETASPPLTPISLAAAITSEARDSAR
ncbi:hypothetical protein V2J09_006018, partial [Rumex salicifolius]